MSAVIDLPPAAPPDGLPANGNGARPSVRRFSVKEYDAMIEHSILTTEDRVELLNGEIINKMPKGPQHSSATDRAARFFIRALSDDFIVRNQIQFGWMKCPNLNRIWL